MRSSVVLIPVLLLAAAACGRGTAVESEPGPVYMLVVENPMAHPMDVWYDDGVELHDLGRVDAQAARDFVIAAPASPSVRVVARDDGRTHTIQRDVTLSRAATPRVVLTP